MIVNSTTIVGTADQVLVNGTTGTTSGGRIVLTLPQSVGTTSSPSFNGLSLSGVTANSFLYAGTTGALSTTTAPTNGQLLVGSTGNAPVAATLSTGNGISVTNGPGTITVTNTGVLSFSAGTTGLTPSTSTTGNVTLGGVLGVANGGTGSTTAPVNGALLVGNGSTYIASTLTSGPGILISNGSGSVTISATSNALRQAGAVDIGPLAGTAQISTAAAPTAFDGFQIATITVTPISSVSKFVLSSLVWADNSNTNRSVQLAVFRNNVLVGTSSSVITTSGRPQTLGILINDAPATTSTLVYTLRIGANGTGTTYVNQSGTYTLGNSGKSSFTIDELIV